MPEISRCTMGDMRRPGARLTIRRMLLATAILAAAFGSARAAGALGVGLAIVLSCVVGLSSARFSRALTLRRENG